jgi:hypothetical protein
LAPTRVNSPRFRRRRVREPSRVELVLVSLGVPVQHNSRACKSTLKEAGGASERFQPAEPIARKACSKYEAAARYFGIVLSVSEPGGGVIVGSPQERIYKRAFDRALTAQADGSNLMTRAEQKATLIQSEIELESS